jgi:hypothetical protein
MFSIKNNGGKNQDAKKRDEFFSAQIGANKYLGIIEERIFCVDVKMPEIGFFLSKLCFC